MDVNFLVLIGNLIRLSFVFRFNLKKQQEASEKNFKKEENKDLLVGCIAIVVFTIWGVLTYVIKW
ncbi:hypothetical protein [Chryseobacterium vrystaatense]|uniref:Uncharacterized protein n=1 Tax=Chryseobacterium vrystaatense TaxID=307480 RepID=A0A1M5LQ61_9FLAO|nr:hypothetical protein [Chryseobacterium vrystaatense]SHG67188.1 hypothetical protein SAMN02787073_4621 [Chryseobacterium vrystaatense]